jgi:hypothetical protein
MHATSAAEGAGKRSGKVRLLSLSDLDRRTRAAALAFDTRDALLDDLGGAETASIGHRQLCQRAAVLAAMLEDSESRFLSGDEIEIETYLAAINAQRRVLATIGLERRARDVTPGVGAYLAAKAERTAPAPSPASAPPDDDDDT